MTQQLDKARALAICFSNLKGSKSKDLLLTARALEHLKELPEFGTNQRVGEAVGVSGETVRQFVGLLELPCTVQSYFEQGMLGLEQGRRLLQIERARPEIVEYAARAMVSITAMEARDLAEHLTRNPMSSVEASVEALEAARKIITKEFHIDTVLDEQAYLSLRAQARKRNVQITDLACTIVNEWLEQHDTPVV